jgi:glyoxylase-like metal-dependent hydrolase (beta-lactamase superfamily II)
MRAGIRHTTALAAACGWFAMQPGEPEPVQSPAFSVVRIAEGVYATQFGSSTDAGRTGNATIIVNDDDVIVIDTYNTPATARALIGEIRRLTPKPVRLVINTHWHGDHVFGNQAFHAAFPAAEFIGHPTMREDFEKEEVPGLRAYIDSGLPAEQNDLRTRLAAGTRRDGTPYTEEQRRRIVDYVAQNDWLLRELRSVRPTLPTLLVTDSLVLHRGERTIEIRNLGQGNTRGDLTVYLPRERILITGDLLVHPMPYGVGAFPAEWVGVMRRLRELPTDVIVPGHGAIQRDYRYFDQVLALLQSTASQAQRAVAEGRDLERTRAAVNLDSLRMVFTGGDSARFPVFDGNYTGPAVERAWREARGELRSR